MPNLLLRKKMCICASRLKCVYYFFQRFFELLYQTRFLTIRYEECTSTMTKPRNDDGQSVFLFFQRLKYLFEISKKSRKNPRAIILIFHVRVLYFSHMIDLRIALLPMTNSSSLLSSFTCYMHHLASTHQQVLKVNCYCIRAKLKGSWLIVNHFPHFLPDSFNGCLSRYTLS